MKVKKILLSMCAIAALASCSQNDDVAVPTDSAPPAKVTIRFAGSEGMTRAIGSDDAVVNNLTAFFFNTAGALIKAPRPVAGNDLKPENNACHHYGCLSGGFGCQCTGRYCFRRCN